MLKLFLIMTSELQRPLIQPTQSTFASSRSCSHSHEAQNAGMNALQTFCLRHWLVMKHKDRQTGLRVGSARAGMLVCVFLLVVSGTSQLSASDDALLPGSRNVGFSWFGTAMVLIRYARTCRGVAESQRHVRTFLI